MCQIWYISQIGDVNQCMQHMLNKVICVIVVFLLHPLESWVIVQ